MLKILLKHIAIEKAIDIFFQKIFKNFTTNSKRYSKVFIKNSSDIDGNIFAILYNAEIIEYPADHNLVSARFEYFRYCDNEYDWKNEINMSNPVKKPDMDVFYQMHKQHIIKKI